MCRQRSRQHSRATSFERGLQQPPLQLAAPGPDHLLPLPVVEVPRLLSGPGGQACELLRRGGEPRRHFPSSGASLPSSRTCLIVTENLTATSRCLPGMISAHHPGHGPLTRGTRGRMPSRPFPARTTDTTLTSNNHCGHCRKHPETPGLSQYKRFIKEISRYSYLSKRRTPPPSGVPRCVANASIRFSDYSGAPRAACVSFLLHGRRAGMRVLYGAAAAVDVGKDVIAVAVRLPGDGPDGRATRSAPSRRFTGCCGRRAGGWIRWG